MSLFDNDPDVPHTSVPDASGEAALLLVESLVHTLIERSVLSVEDAVGCVHAAIEMRTARVPRGRGTEGPGRDTLELLFRIVDSLATDLPGNRPGASKTV